MNFKKSLITLLASALLLTTLSSCYLNGAEKKAINTSSKFSSFEEVLNQGKNKDVTIFMWGGNDNINKYMDNFVTKNIKSLYGINLKRVPMDAPVFISKLLNEKKNNLSTGTADLLWINAENFRTAKDAGLLYGPFTEILPNLNKYYDKNSSDLTVDSGITIDGYEGIWGKAQLVLTYDSEVIKSPPKSFKELLALAKKNPGKFTYPKVSDDFAGAAFLRTAYYELTGKSDIFQKDITKEEFIELSKPVVDYFTELNKYLWHNGKAYPSSQAQQDELFKNGELLMTMGFEVFKSAGLVTSGIYKNTVKTFVFNTGTIGNSHYLAVPYNSPNKAAALLVMDYLESPVSQIEKLKTNVWGDMPAFDESKLDSTQKSELLSVLSTSLDIELKQITDHRLPEMKSNYIDWIKEIWTNQIVTK